MDNKVLNLVSDFETIRQTDDNGNCYWSARDLCIAMGYSTYQKFSRIIEKAKSIIEKQGNLSDHFNHTVRMVKLGSGAFRNSDDYQLSVLACKTIAEIADKKKPQTMQALNYFNDYVNNGTALPNTQTSNILIYKSNSGEVKIEVIFNSETFWMTQKRMGELYGVETNTINYHLKELFATGEIEEKSVVRKIRITASDGKDYDTLVYNLDASIAVGYRVNSYQATQFRIWATKALKELIIKGFVLDDERLKQGTAFGKDYFDDLLERIREIRISERRYYQKITDIYAECSIDYDSKSQEAILFFKTVQNMMHWAVAHQTAPEIIYSRANAEMPNMGLTTWKNAPNGRIQKSDSIVAKNYLSDKEINDLNKLSSSFIDMAEMRAERHQTSTMADWKSFLEQFLSLNQFDVLKNAGTISAEMAKSKAYSEYDKFRVIQDKEFMSDFDKFIKELEIKGK